MSVSVIKSRGELIGTTETVELTASFYDDNGNLADTVGFPKISIVSPSGLVILNYTSAGVSRVSTGVYMYSYVVPFDGGGYGVFSDVWQGAMSNGRVETQTLQFVVEDGQLPKFPNSDGYYSLGDDVGFNYSQLEIFNINKLLKGIRARLNSSGKSKSTDAFGNVIYVDCDIFSTDQLVTFLGMALSFLNEIPHFTFFKFSDSFIIDIFYEVLVSASALFGLCSIALIERGREFQITDNGIAFQPPSVSELLNSQWNTELTSISARIALIKQNMKSAPLGLGSFSAQNGANPAVRRLRFLRSRRIY